MTSAPERDPRIAAAFEEAGQAFSGQELLTELQRVETCKLAAALKGWAQEIRRLLRASGRLDGQFTLANLANLADIGRELLKLAAPACQDIAQIFADYLTERCDCPAVRVNSETINVDLSLLGTAPAD